MAVDLLLDGEPLSTITNFSVVEDSTPVIPSDTTGGVGQFTFDIKEGAPSLALLGTTARLTDGAQGTTVGTIRGLSGGGGTTTVTADSRMGLLAVERTAQPYVGTLGGAFVYYLSLVGVTSGFVIDDTIANIPVVFPGWHGYAWDYIKKMCIAQRVETSLVSDNIVLRPLRTRLAENYRDSSVTWSLDTTGLARAIEIYSYNNLYRAGALVYPSGGWNEDVQIQTVDASKTITVDIPVNASLSGIDQPVCVDFVDRNYIASSVYTVAGNDGLPVPHAQWLAGGGSVTVAVGEDTRSLVVTIVGSRDTQYAPYRIAMSAGASDYYSSLRIVGTGVFSDKTLLTLPTSVNPDQVSSDVGATVDNEFISTPAQTQSLGLWALRRWGNPRYTLNVNTTGINRIGDSGSYAYPTIAEVNAAYAGMTVGQVDALWAGKTLGDFDQFWADTKADDFTNQAFGNVAGARVLRDGNMFRIRTTTITPANISYTAEEDSTVGDLNTVWTGKTVADFDAQWAGKTVGDFTIAPLMKDVY